MKDGGSRATKHEKIRELILTAARKLVMEGGAPGNQALVEKPAWMRARSRVHSAIPGNTAVTEDDAVVGGWALLHGLTGPTLAGPLIGLVRGPGELLERADPPGGLSRRGFESFRGEITHDEIDR